MSTTEEQERLAVALKDAILKAYNPEVVILFGSLGRGDADEFSDVDLFLVIETDKDNSKLSEEIEGCLDSITKNKHIIVTTPLNFFRQRDIPGTLSFSAVKDGQILFEKQGWLSQHFPVDSYGKRKREVIQNEYFRSANEYLTRAELSLKRGNLFRCRDFTRFAAIKAAKGLFVKHDIHPPRETDLENLIYQVKELEPDLAQYTEFIRELNCYHPGAAGKTESRISCSMVDRTKEFVQVVMVQYYPDK
ncbi:nucleotidyltransferase domain-containing protein [Thermodesulfobacteriota bacterium]